VAAALLVAAHVPLAAAQAPVFNTEPSNTSASAGSSVAFVAHATGDAPLTYQWQHNGLDLAGATNTTLALFNLRTNQAGLYRAIARNPAGAATSQVARLEVTFSPPVLTGQSSSVTVPAGGRPSFCVWGYGAPSPTYQWQFAGVDIPGATSTCLTLYNVTPYQAGPYRVIASNEFGMATSAVVTVTVSEVSFGPTLYSWVPFDQQAALHSDTYLEVAGTGSRPIRYQWYFEGGLLPGATNATLWLRTLQTNQAGHYFAVASNAFGMATSRVATVTVEAGPPVFQYGAGEVQAYVGSSYFYLYAAFSGGPRPALQWYHDGQLLPGATNLEWTLLNLTTNDAGAYTVVATNIFGVATGLAANVTVIHSAPQIGSNPSAGQSVLEGADVSLYAYAYGGPPPSVWWQFNGVDLPEARFDRLWLRAVTTNQAGLYRLIASNSLGMATSSVCRLTVQQSAPTALSFWPDPADAVEGGQVMFYASASAGPPAGFHPYKDGVPVTLPPGRWGYSLPEVSTNDGGFYTLVASNALGLATSGPVRLNVRAAGPLDRWHRRNPLPQGNHLLAMTEFGGALVAVGEHGTVLTSTNGTNWAVQPIKLDIALHGIVHANGLLVAVGEAETILTSTDGVEWTLRRTGGDRNLYGVAYGNGRFVAVGMWSTVLVSSDGVTWEDADVDGDLNNSMAAVLFANGQFVAVGDRIWTSNDALEWAVQPTYPDFHLECVIHDSAGYVAAGGNGYILTSNDGLKWSQRSVATNRRVLGLACGNGLFVGVGARGTLLYSPDSLSWMVAEPATPDRLETVLFWNGMFVAAGENGTILTARDGVWANQNIGTRRDLDCMTQAEGLIVIVGKYGTILTSRDGIYYDEQDAGTTNDLHGVAYGDGQFVAVGDPGVILTSQDAAHWTIRNSGTENYLKSVAYGEGVWVVAGSYGTILRSTNGVDWAWADAGALDELQEVAFGDGKFVIVGDDSPPNGSIFVSADGRAWANRSLFTGKNLRGVTWADGLFMAVGNDGTLLVSSDGDNWQARNTGVFLDGDNLRAVTRANGLWMVVGNHGLALSSSNTVQWTRHATRTLENLHGVRGLNGAFVTMGNRGTILQSWRVTPTVLVIRNFWQEGGFELAVHGEPGRTHRLQGSSDLREWIDLFTFSSVQERTIFLDEAAVHYPQRFYRVVSP